MRTTLAARLAEQEGHQITVSGFRSKTSDHIANARTVKLADGRQVFAGSRSKPASRPIAREAGQKTLPSEASPGRSGAVPSYVARAR